MISIGLIQKREELKHLSKIIRMCVWNTLQLDPEFSFRLCSLNQKHGAQTLLEKYLWRTRGQFFVAGTLLAFPGFQCLIVKIMSALEIHVMVHERERQILSKGGKIGNYFRSETHSNIFKFHSKETTALCVLLAASSSDLIKLMKIAAYPSLQLCIFHINTGRCLMYPFIICKCSIC